jgi:hypothetical protein
MRPNIGDLLAGIKKTFGEVIVPALKDPFALEQASFIMLALEHLAGRWDKVERFCREENAGLRRLLAEAVASPGADAAVVAREVVESIRERLAAEDVTDREARSVQSLFEANAALRALLIGLSDAIKDDGFRRKIRAWLKQQLEREREWVKVGEFVW